MSDLDKRTVQEARDEGFDDCISRHAAIESFSQYGKPIDNGDGTMTITPLTDAVIRKVLKGLPSAQPEIVRCKDCKFYSPMNRETKTGICNLTIHQSFGDDWFCAGAERRQDDVR